MHPSSAQPGRCEPPPLTSGNAAFFAAFFLFCATLPWLNPVSGGAMTPAIPLLLGWCCITWLFMQFPAPRISRPALLAGIFLVVTALCGVWLDRAWQMLCLSLLMMGAAAATGASLVQSAGNNGLRHGVQPLSDVPQAVCLIAWSWLLAGLLNAAIGLLQYFQHTAWLGELVNHAPVGQVYGNLRQRNQYATLMLMALWALWYLWHSGGLRHALQKTGGMARAPGAIAPDTLLAWGLMLPLTICTALTMSRTGLFQMAALVGMLGLWSWRQPAFRALVWWLGAMVLVYVLASFVMPHLAGMTDMLTRLEGSDSRACISRKVLWGNVLHLIAQKPWLGWGWGNLEYAHYYANYPGMRFCELLDNAHDLPLHLAVELGVPAALIACGTVLWWIWRNQPWREQAPHRQLMWGVLGAMGIHSLLEYPLWYAPFQLACGLALGVLWTTARTSGQGDGAAAHMAGAEQAKPQWPALVQRPALLGQRLLAVLMLIGLAYASFDYVRVTQLYRLPQDRVWPFNSHTQAQAERTLLYRNAVDFAKMGMEDITPATAQQHLALAHRLMHYSAEARVVEHLIESLRLLGRDDEAQAEEVHYREVYPHEYAKWKAEEEAEEDMAEPASQ